MSFFTPLIPSRPIQIVTYTNYYSSLSLSQAAKPQQFVKLILVKWSIFSPKLMNKQLQIMAQVSTKKCPKLLNVSVKKRSCNKIVNCRQTDDPDDDDEL